MKKITTIFVLAFTLLAMSVTAFAWGPRMDVKPAAYKAGQNQGYFIWSDNNGFHLWTTTRGQKHVFSGTITTDGNRFDIKAQGLEDRKTSHPFLAQLGKDRVGKDRVQIDNDRDTIRFRFESSGKDSDGMTFKVVGGSRVKFDLYIDGKRINPSDIYIGGEGWHPGSSTFTMYK